MRSHRLVLAVATASILSFPALAADMAVRHAPVYKAPVVTPDMFSGLSIGAEIGYGWGTSDTGDLVTVLSIPDYKTDGIVGGLNATYRWRTAPNGYLGIATAIDGADLKDTNTIAAGVTTTGKQTWLGTTGVQIGFTPTGNVLLYAGGGVAYGNVKGDVRFRGAASFSHSDTRVGWYVGAGFDVASTPNWSWGVEYKYIDLGKTDVNIAPAGISGHIDTTDNLVLFNIKYRFAGY